MNIIPFKKEYIQRAADLLVVQSKYLIEQFPLLPKRITELEASQSFLNTLLKKPDAHGVVAVDGDQITGFMLGTYDKNIFFGRYVWVPFGGFALRDMNDTDLLRKLYAAAGDQWVQDNVLNHYIVCPDVANWQQAFFSLTFGQEQACAVAPARQLKKSPEPLHGIVLREIQPHDADQMHTKAHWISEHLNQAPVWEPVPDEHLKKARPIYAEMASDPTSTTWVALDGNQIVSYACIYGVAVGDDQLLGIPKAAHFGAAATDPKYRRKGIGRALFTHLLNIARQQGYEIILTDWRTTNLTAARYWLTFGFVPFAYRLLRRVNPIYAPYHSD